LNQFEQLLLGDLKVLNFGLGEGVKKLFIIVCLGEGIGVKNLWD
jgi:hypothetical protein